MRPGGTARFALAFAVAAILGELVLSDVLTVGSRFGLLGVVAVLVLAGFGLALLFTAMYEGPRALRHAVRRRSPRSSSPSRGSG